MTRTTKTKTNKSYQRLDYKKRIDQAFNWKAVLTSKITTGLSVAVIIGSLAYSLFGQVIQPGKKNGVVLAANAATGYTLRYKTTTKGAMVFTGNALGLNTYAEYQPGKIDGSIDVFTTLDTSLKEGNFPAGTTKDWRKNSSAAQLKIPETAEVLYAELVWGANYQNVEKGLNIESEINTPVKFKTPQGEFQVSGDSTTAANTQYGYVRTANVTSQVKASKAGTYSIAGVPALLTPEEKSDNYAGWNLAVVYSDTNSPARNLTLYTGAETVFVNKQDGNTVKVSGFGTPVQGDFTAKIFISTQEGDSDLEGDQLQFGTTADGLRPVSGPNNMEGNFFGAQINDYDGKLDTSGTFGNLNHNPGTSAGGNRQGFDITTVDVSDRMDNNQTEAYIKGTSRRDVYVINSLGFQIDVNAPFPKVTIQRDKPTVRVGQTITYTIDVVNDGPIDAQNSVLKSLIPEGTSLVPGSFKINGQDSNLNPANPVDLESITPGERINLLYTVKVDRLPPSNVFENEAGVEYKYTQVAGEEPKQEETYSSKVITFGLTILGQPPVATDDQSKTLKNQPVTIDVLTNDTDPDGDINPASLKVTGQPTNGGVTISNGKAVYTPAADFVGTDTFEYEVCDQEEQCDKAMVTVNIKEAQLPVAVDDQGRTRSGVPVELDILANDTDPIDGVQPGDFKRIVTQPQHGTITPNPTTGKATYTSQPNYIGNDTFTYEICNTDGCDQATVTIEVGAKNVPNAQDDRATTPEGQPVTLDLPVNDTDPVNSLKLDTVKITVPPQQGNVAIVPGTGKATYTPKTGFSGDDFFTYEICNADGECDTAQGIITVQPTQPPVANDDTGLTKGEPVAVDVLTNDTDPEDKLNPATLEIIGQPAHGQVIPDPGTGKIVYTPNPGYTGPDNITYQICNEYNKCDSADVKITVQPQLPPNAVNDLASTKQNQPVTIDVLTNDTDPLDEIQPEDLKSIKVQPQHGTANIDATTGKINYVPNENYAGNDSFTYEICNADGCDQAIVSVDVKAPNKPDAQDDNGRTNKDKPITIDVLANDTDPANSLKPETTKIQTQPAHGQVTVDTTNGKVTYTPQPGYVGPDQFSYQICNAENECDIANVIMEVVAPAAPTANDDTAETITNQPVTVNVVQNDTDPDDSLETSSIEIVQQPTNGQAQVGPDGQITYTPNKDYAGQDRFVYKICNTAGECDSAEVRLTISLPNTPGKTIAPTPRKGTVLGARDKAPLSRTGGEQNLLIMIVGLAVVGYIFYQSQAVKKTNKNK
ncbi:MAG: hypothetical protein OHK0017_04000 [Patescibacteria group bacterium]